MAVEPTVFTRHVFVINIIEGLNRESGRRTRVVGSFPEDNSAPP